MSPSLPRRAIVTYARNRIAYVSVKSLAKRGVDVTAADSTPFAMSFFSRYCSKRLRYPSPFLYPHRFIQAMAKYVEDNPPCVLLPTHNEAFILARYLEELPDKVVIPIASYESLIALHLKDRLLDLADRVGVATPPTHLVESIPEVQKLATDLKYPVYIKLRSGYGNHGLEYVKSRAELLPKFLKVIKSLRLLPHNYPIIQESVQGKKIAVIMLMNKGRLRAKYTYIHLRALQRIGGTATLRTGTVDPDGERSLEQILKHLHWHGLAQAEFIIEEPSHKPIIIDANPRFPGSIYQAIRGGVDFPYLLYRMSVEGDIKTITGGENSHKTRWFWGDLHRLLTQIKQSPGRLQALQEFLRLNDSDTFYDDLDPMDPIPFLMSPLPNLIQLLRTGRLDPPTPFLRYNLNPES